MRRVETSCIMSFLDTVRSLPWHREVSLLKVDENGLLAVEKGAGIMSHPNKPSDRKKALLDAPYEESMQAYVLGDREGGGERFAYLLNRLDSATSGIVLLALDQGVASSALHAFERKAVRKVYVALVFGSPRKGAPIWRDRLTVKRAEGGVRAESGGALMAETQLAKIEAVPGPPLLSRLTLIPVTGRTHQLRIQTAKRDVPIVGDRTYGDFQKNKQFAKAKGVKRLCLHCVETALTYRLGSRSFSFKARSPAPF